MPKNCTSANLLFYEKRDAVVLYSQILNEKIKYEEAITIVQTLITSYPYFEESFFALVVFFNICQKQVPNAMLEIYELFHNIYEHFCDSEYMNFIVCCIAKYLIKLPIDGGDVNFINFAANMLQLLKKEPELNEKIIKELKYKRQKNILAIVKESAKSGQIVFVIRQCQSFLSDKSLDLEIHVLCLTFLIKSFYALQDYYLCQRYLKQLKTRSLKYFLKLPLYIRNLEKI